MRQSRTRLLVWAVATAILMLASPDEPRADAGEAKQLIVMIDGEIQGRQVIGSGIIIGSGADRLYIATANHVVRRGPKKLEQVRVRLKFLPGQEIEAEVLSDFDRDLDLAVLSVNGVQALAIPLEEIPFQLVGTAAGLKRGDEVFTIGYPRGQRWQVNVSPDLIAETIGDSLEFESQLVANGHSGGGLFDKDWNLVGMITADQPPNGVAVRIDRVLEQMKHWDYPVELTRREPETLPPAQNTETAAIIVAAPPEAPPAFDARAVELAFWNSIEKSADPADFEDYLSRYPHAAFSGLAKRRLTALTEVAALPPPTAATPGYEIEEIDETYYVLKRANVRSGPGTSFDKVGRLSVGAEVGVTGKVLGKRWLRIALEGGDDAYVYGPLLSAEKPKPPEPVVVEEKPQPADNQVAVGVYPSTGALTPGKTFQDCSDCPEMVVVPPGSFMMGSTSYEEGRDDDEGPQHRVMIPRSFAVGKYEVTRGQYAVFARETDHGAGDGCFTYTGSEWKKSGSKSWRDPPGFRQTDRDPVVCVSWDDAQAYVSWLNGKTGKNYRLLSEAEWEYVTRAGTSTARYWGESSSSQCDYANGADRASGLIWATSCNDGESHTSPVGKYRTNEFGLHDVLGNVWEWVEDCWNDSYAGAPSEGTAWVRGDCTQRVLRGGSWGGSGRTGTTASGIASLLGLQRNPGDLRSADRYELPTGVRSYVLGIRVARTL